ncbi:MAG: FAD:protein FMN transferase [Kiritimatiellia bacterium]|jgi:thiamine biosynthesis lipoprotein
MKLANFPPVLRILLLAVLLSVMTACRQAALPHKTFLVMGTFFTVTLPADYADYLEPAGVLSANALYGLENQLSLFNSESDIGRLNRAAGGAPIPVSEETIAILRAAHRYGEISGGAFDITIPPLMKVWGLRGGPAPEHTPSPAALTEALQHVDFRRVEIGDQTARLASPGMQADLGGIAKGFAVDEVARIMLKNGLTNILINLGGNIRAQGYATPSAPWHVAIQNPFAEERVLGKLALRDGEAVATSGNYERFVTIGGRRYAHILDPRTGRPVEGMASVTIITTGPDAAMDADALSTTLFVMGYEQGAGFLATNFPDFAVLFVPARQPLELYATPAFATRFTPAPEYANRVRLLP